MLLPFLPRCLVIVGLIFLNSSTGIANVESAPAARVVLSFHAQHENDLWKIRTLSETISGFIATFKRAKLLPESEEISRQCAQNRSCLILAARKTNANALIIGILRPSELELSSVDPLTRRTVAFESVKLGGNLSLEDLRHRTFKIMRPFTQAGGLIDQRTALQAQSMAISDSILTYFGTQNIPLSLLFFLMGIAWSFAVMKALSQIVPTLRKTESLDYLMVYSIIKNWAGVVVLRGAAFLATALPLFLIIRGLALFVSLGSFTLWAFVVPILLSLGSLSHSYIMDEILVILNANARNRPESYLGTLATGFGVYLHAPSIDVEDLRFWPGGLWSRILALGFTCAFLFAGGFHVLKTSVDYHPIWQERIQKMRDLAEQPIPLIKSLSPQDQIQQEKTHVK